jgi:hypothetical protein
MRNIVLGGDSIIRFERGGSCVCDVSALPVALPVAGRGKRASILTASASAVAVAASRRHDKSSRGHCSPTFPLLFHNISHSIVTH